LLSLEKLAARPTTGSPFPHLTAQDLLPEMVKADLARDFPDESKAGFFPVEQLSYGPSFAALLEDLRTPEFSKIVGEKLDRDLVDRPKMIVVRKWSAAKDGARVSERRLGPGRRRFAISGGAGPRWAGHRSDSGALWRVRRFRAGGRFLAWP
jgi:hypothetical protein